MGKAARVIIIENNKMLVMFRRKYDTEYFTLVGGRVNDNEEIEDALVREVAEETGLHILKARPVFYEKHPEPYNEQFIFLAEVAPHGDVALQSFSEEAMLNRSEVNIHEPMWVDVSRFKSLPFRTPLLQEAIIMGFKKGFPDKMIKL